MPKTIHRPEYRRLIDSLRKQRESNGMTQTACAAALGWRQQRLAAVESCSRRIDVLEYIELARVLGLDASGALKLAIGAAHRVGRASR